MQLSASFSFLLTALLVALTQVEASPTKRTPGIVTLPLKRVVQRSDVHPSVRLQQNINHAHRRHARMTGREAPSTAELEILIKKRLNLALPPTNDKRYDHTGVKKVSASGGRTEGGLSLKAGDGKADPKDGFPEAALAAQLAGDLTKAKKPTTKNSLGLSVEGNDVAYIATVQVGTPPRDFSVLMDSGSADFWIGGEDCQSQGGGGCGNHVFLGNSSSSTFEDTGTAWSVRYGSGSVNGTIVTDNVEIAGLALSNHTFGVAHIETEEFSDNSTKFDGLLGTAKSSISNQGVPTPVEALAKQGLINEAITSYKISRISDGLNDGQITFGGLDRSKFDPSTLVTFQNVNQEGFWEGPVSISVDGNSVLRDRTAILDTGTTLILAPPAEARALHAKIPGSKSDGQGGFIIPCTNAAVVSLTFGGRAFDINPIDLLFSPVDQNDLKGDCISGIVARTFGGPQEWLVGDVFLKNVYFSHNGDKDEISLAELV